MDWGKVISYVGFICIVIAATARIIAGIVPNFHDIDQVDQIVRWAIILWAYASVSMGVYLKHKTGRSVELVVGIAAAATLCIEATIGIFVGLIYFARAFAKLSKMKDELPF